MSKLRYVLAAVVVAAGVLSGVLVLSLTLSASVAAQTVNNAFGGMSKNSDQPIDIESDTLTVYDEKKLAMFKGNVKAVQGTTTLLARELHVHYTGGGANRLTGQPQKTSAAAPAPVEQTPAEQPTAADPRAASQDGETKDPKSQIKKIEARGEVVISSEDDQTTTSDWAIYDVPAQQVTVGGNVVLSQGQNVLKGDRLVIDLATGESRFENTGTTADGSKRIRALFLPKEEDKKPDKAKRENEAGGADAQPPQ